MFKISNEYFEEGLSNYDILMDQAYEYTISKSTDVCIVTFYYDTLLDKSFERVYNSKIKSVDDYLAQRIKILKVHGSCNWSTLG